MNGYLKIILATFLFSISPPIVKVISLDAISIIWAMNLTGVLVLTIRAIVHGRSKEVFDFKGNFGVVLLLGITTTINNVFFLTAVKTTTIANAMLTHYLNPIFVILFGYILLREKVTKSTILALVMSLSGLAIMMLPNELTFSNAHFLGIMLGTGSAVFLGLEVVFKKMLSKRMPSDIVVLQYLTVPVILLLPFVSYKNLFSLDPAGIFGIIFIGTALIAGGITLFISGLKQVKAQKAGVLSYIEPLGAILWGLLILKEWLSLETIIGGLLILLGTYLVIKK
ncbi:EamA family transporter [Candidatus Woesearchaeota archaeon]|nr:EamA family transporter [Candidatus Woesearchaeota archaeon]